MARTNAFLSAGNNNRQVSLGGRRAVSNVWARLNTDNGGGHDVSLFCKAEVVGERHRNGKARKTCHSCGYVWKEGGYTHVIRGVVQEGYSNDFESTWNDGDSKLVECPNENCRAERQGVDTRKTFFTVELPKQTNGEHCEVSIRPYGAHLGVLAKIGALLCLAKGVDDIAKGEEEDCEVTIGRGEKAIEFARQTFQSLDERLKGREYSNVFLPGGVSLAKALACVAIVERIAKPEGGDFN